MQRLGRPNDNLVGAHAEQQRSSMSRLLHNKSRHNYNYNENDN